MGSCGGNDSIYRFYSDKRPLRISDPFECVSINKRPHSNKCPYSNKRSLSNKRPHSNKHHYSKKHPYLNKRPYYIPVTILQRRQST